MWRWVSRGSGQVPPPPASGWDHVPPAGLGTFWMFCWGMVFGREVKLTMSPQRGHMRVLKGNSSGAEGEMVPHLGGCQIQGEGPWTMSPQRGSNTCALLLRQIWNPGGAQMENNFVVQSSLCNLYCAISANKKSTDPKYKECKRNI